MHILYCIGTYITCLLALLLTCINYRMRAHTTESMRTLMYLGIHSFTCAFFVVSACIIAGLHIRVRVFLCTYINGKSRVAN